MLASVRNGVVGALGLAAVAAFVSVGCAGPADDGETEASDEALTSKQLSGVKAVEVAEVRSRTTVLSSKVLGAPKKVKRLLSTVKKLRPNQPAPRCLEQDTTRLTFLDPNGAKLATMNSYCAGFGTISFEDGRAGYGVTFDPAAVTAAKDAPFAVGDALWGITKIEVTRPGSADRRTVTGSAVAPVVAGFDLDAVPDENVGWPRCVPTHELTFDRGDLSVAVSGFICERSAPGVDPAKMPASFLGWRAEGGDPARGGITVDARPVIAIFDSTQ